MNDQSKTIKPLRFEIGWLAPDGTYYGAEIGDSVNRNHRLHHEIGEQIVLELYPDMIANPDTIPGMFRLKKPYSGSTQLYEFLHDQGFAKIDVEEVTLPGDHYTQKQIDTLFDLHQHPYASTLPTMREAIRKALVVSGMGFLSRPGDEYHPEQETVEVVQQPSELKLISPIRRPAAGANHD